MFLFVNGVINGGNGGGGTASCTGLDGIGTLAATVAEAVVDDDEEEDGVCCLPLPR